MIKINNSILEDTHFPDGSLLIKYYTDEKHIKITWFYENEEELIRIYHINHHLRNLEVEYIELYIPYLPNARQDRVKSKEDVFTLKYFAQLINSLKLDKIKVLDVHSYVSEALVDRIEVLSPYAYIDKSIASIVKEQHISTDDLILYYPDEGAMKRYSGMLTLPYVFGIKKRDFATGMIQGLDIAGDKSLIKEKSILIIDDICSKGGTFLHSSRKLRDLGADSIYLYVSHCEHTILDGELIKTDLIKKIFTTDSIFRKDKILSGLDTGQINVREYIEKIEVMSCEEN